MILKTTVCFCLILAVLFLSSRLSAKCEGERCGATQLTAGETAMLMKTVALVHREKGDTNQPSAQWLAFQKHLKFGASAKPQIQELLDKATPAGRIYAVILLKQIEPDAAAIVLKKMLKDSSPLNYFRGCEAEETTVKALADRIIKGEELVQMKPDPVKSVSPDSGRG